VDKDRLATPFAAIFLITSNFLLGSVTLAELGRFDLPFSKPLSLDQRGNIEGALRKRGGQPRVIRRWKIIGTETRYALPRASLRAKSRGKSQRNRLADTRGRFRNVDGVIRNFQSPAIVREALEFAKAHVRILSGPRAATIVNSAEHRLARCDRKLAEFILHRRDFIGRTNGIIPRQTNPRAGDHRGIDFPKCIA